ncbi:MAG: VCBS repeat-containing protein [Myxococcales bacterium]|nr:VCBS repeat-containing protein [Myxococcales bacterium]
MHHRFIASAVTAATLAFAGTAAAQSGDVPCTFVSDAALTPLETAGASGALVANGFVAAPALQPYATQYTVDVGVWVDQAFLATTPDAAALALRYLEHANCIFAAGRNLALGNGVNLMSLRIAGDRIRYYDSTTTPNYPGETSPWGQQLNWDWAQWMKGKAGMPAVNLLFTTRGLVEINPISHPAGAANGYGQGNAILAIDPTALDNTTKPNNLDWWGIASAHELTHALGVEGHVAQLYDTDCCTDPGYPAPGYIASQDVALSQTSWNLILDNDSNPEDLADDPFRATRNPVTNAYWDYTQISDFLLDRDGGDVLVATSTGASFLSRLLRHDWFCIDGEVCLTGDFNGDGRDDVVAFTRGTAGDVFVALASGNGYLGTGVKWHDFFAINAETPVVGDWNGDGKDDLASFTGGTAADVYVALSNGHGFVGTGVKWHDGFGFGTELPLVGDWNGDGKDDLAGLTRGTTGDVFVALSTGAGFGARAKWHDWFTINSELPVAGDWNGDGKDDLATFTRGTTGDVYVAFSTGAAFTGTGVKWHDQFAINSELPFAGDVDGDGKDDIVAFARGTLGRVYVARSNGSSAFVGQNAIWTTNLCLGTDTCAVADYTGDGKADALAFHR